MKFAVITFPGSNCDSDMFHAIKDELGEDVAYVNHKETNLAGFDAVLIPGGAAYGDYLRPGAIASLTPITEAIKKAAEKGKPILGVGNGFQILLEMGLLPGALQANRDQKFICRSLDVIVENNQTMFTNGYEEKQNIRIPIAHSEGNYYCDEETLQQLKDKQQIVFTYKENVNGSVENIAGIVNEAGNVLGLMAHPERAVDSLLGSEDGLILFRSILKQWRENNAITS